MSERLDFWARRKAAVQAEEAAEARAVEEQRMAEERQALEEKSDEEILAELNLPDPETLKPGDDVRGFMSQAVPDRLRRRALRQLWKLNPVLANVDGLVDYGEDFTDAALVVENLQTAYQVGKGMLAHVEEMARQAAAKEAALEAGDEADAPDADEADAPETPETAPAEAETPELVAEDEPTSETQENQSDTQYAAAPRRRMRFAFET
ncbi:DUF3306 domain-containing protein [Aestuariivita boseongensis]|uniref:DUF3306 domain-containing protein n=1 Tax=Aestuariivita boseongensis TaxID=1470562 RepID=UPI0006800373|nr:DUF3306 domain-containing protein [Aestuariivita boseongensis]